MSIQAKITYAALLCLSPVAALAEIDPAPYRAEFEACLDQATDPDALRDCGGKATHSCQLVEDEEHAAPGSACAVMERQLWDAYLATLVEKNLRHAQSRDASEAKYAGEASAVWAPSLQEAQRVWEQHREAQCALEAARWGSDALGPVQRDNCLRLMSTERVIYLSKARAQWTIDN